MRPTIELDEWTYHGWLSSCPCIPVHLGGGCEHPFEVVCRCCNLVQAKAWSEIFLAHFNSIIVWPNAWDLSYPLSCSLVPTFGRGLEVQNEWDLRGCGFGWAIEHPTTFWVFHLFCSQSIFLKLNVVFVQAWGLLEGLQMFLLCILYPQRGTCATIPTHKIRWKPT